MAILQKTREKFGFAVSIIIALALLSFILDPNTLQTALQTMSSKNEVGNIGGKSIDYLDFQNENEKLNIVSELTTGNASRTEQQQAQIRNATWQSLLDKYLFIKNAKAAGIRVGKKEMTDLMSGEEMTSPVLLNNPFFMDENGTFSRERLTEFVEQVKSDPSSRLRAYWDYLQTNTNTQQYYAKYGALFTQGNLQTPLMVNNAMDENNISTKVDLVMVPPMFVTDTTVKISSEEIEKYYKAHQRFFKQPSSRDLEYVVFEVKPSAEDVTAVNDAVSAIYDEFSSTDGMKSFLARHSDRSLSEDWYKAGELASVNKEIDDFVFSNAGGVSPIVSSDNVFYVARIMDTAQLPDSVYVRHILLQGSDAAAKADSLLDVLRKGGNFSNLAASYSADTRSSADGQMGNIGWLTQAAFTQIPDFKPVMTAKVGAPFIINTAYGAHIVEVTRRTAPITKKQVALLQKAVNASTETINGYYSQANRFATLAAGGYKNYRAAVDSLGLYSHPMSNVLESNDTYGGIDHAKELTRWAFDNKAGKVSPIITVENNYFFVAALTGVHKEGIAELNEVKDAIRDRLYGEKASKKQAADIAERIKGMTDLQAIADTLKTTVSPDVEIRFSSMAAQGLDGMMIGAVSSAPEGKICGPVAGNIGTFIFRVNSREAGSFFTETDAKNNAQQMNNYTTQMILPVMMEEADVKDHRARFF